jgi:hypothetical protein
MIYINQRTSTTKICGHTFCTSNCKALIFRSGTRKISMWHFFQYNRVLTPGKLEVELLALKIAHYVCMSVTIDGFWIDDQLYGTLWYSVWLHFTIHCHTHTLIIILYFSISHLLLLHYRENTRLWGIHSHVFTSYCLVVVSNGGRSLPLGSQSIPSLSCQLLTATAHNDLTSAVHWLTDWLTDWFSHSPTK